MKLAGSFGVMSAADVLQWIMTAQKTGCLEIQRRNVRRSIFCRDGRVIACSSADPLVLMGQFLLYNGWISEEMLKSALEVQEESKENLGSILVEMGAIRQEQLLQVVSSKAMETIHGIFDWDDATFEFVPDAQPTPQTIEVDLEVNEILLEGARRLDEMTMMREVFPSRAAVPATTDIPPDATMIASPMARRIYEAVDGRRTLAEIMLACRASEYRTCQFLLRLHEMGMVTVREEAAAEPEAEAETRGLEHARDLLGRGDTCAAYDILHDLLLQEPGDTAVSTFLSEVEVAMIGHLYRSDFPPDVVPVVTRDQGEIGAMDLSAEERYLLQAVDGDSDVKSIVFVAPMTLAEILRNLKRLLDRQVIRIAPDREKAPAGAG